MIRLISIILFELTQIINYLLSLVIIYSIIVFNILFYLFPTEKFIVDVINRLSDLRFYLLIAFGLAGFGFFLGLISKKFKLVNPFSYTKAEISTFAISSFFLAYYYKLSYSFLNRFGYLSLIGLFFIFFMLLPQIVNYYLNLSIIDSFKLILYMYSKEVDTQIISFRKLYKVSTKDLRNLSPRKWVYVAANVFGALLKIYVFSIGVILIVVFAVLMAATFSYTIYSYREYQKNLKRSFYIVSIKPSSAFYAEPVEITGYNLGWSWNEKSKLRSNYGDIPAGPWTDTKVTFSVPLHLKPGKVILWLERVEDPFSHKIIKSNFVEFTVLN